MSAGVLTDANVLYSRTLRDWICLLAFRKSPMFHLTWTEDILAELIYHIRKKHPHYSDAQVGGIRDRIIAVAPYGRIKGNVIDSDLAYTDDYDAHLHAAAVQYVVTDDKRFLDFAETNDAILSYEVYTADDFLMLVNQSSPAAVREVLLEQIDYHRRRGGAFNLPASLEAAGATHFAQVIRELMRSRAVADALARPLTATAE
ncbi:hypothetical protein [Rhodococcus jostii]|uniref:hypothetical protein n=1 Tax=Rhodococcus jostii TaxID=132919 RepID=UPI0005A2C2C7|nr:hypothetical protein [Rhodococcus jostii]